MKFSLKTFGLLGMAALAMTFTSCNDDDDNGGTTPPAGPTQNIVEIAVASPQYSILVGALTATGLDATLAGPGPFTVFAPDNDAFNSFFDDAGIPAGTNEERLSAAAAALGLPAIEDLLLYHVLGGQVLASEVPENAYVTTASTASPGDNQISLRIQSGTAGVTLNNSAAVNAADIRATNGVIHGIDAVLTLPTVVDHALNNPDVFSSLVGAVASVDLVETLQGPGPFTVFAPTNDAFAALGEAPTGEALQNVLLYHVLSGNVRSTDLAEGPVFALNESSFNVVFNEDGTAAIVDANGNTVNVILTDVQGTNGVVHVIDAVLLP